MVAVEGAAAEEFLRRERQAVLMVQMPMMDQSDNLGLQVPSAVLPVAVGLGCRCWHL